MSRDCLVQVGSLPATAGLDASALTLFQVTAGSGSPWGRQGSCTLLPTSTVMSLGTLVNTGVTARQEQGLALAEPRQLKVCSTGPALGQGRPGAPSALPGARLRPRFLPRSQTGPLGCQPPCEQQPQGSSLPVHVAPALHVSPRPQPPGAGDNSRQSTS